MKRVHHNLGGRGWSRALKALTASLAVTMAVAACGGSNTTGGSSSNDLLSKLRKSGTINIGLPNDPPASIINPDGSVSGEGPVTVEKIMVELGIAHVHGIVGTFGELVPGLQAGRWDMIGGVISVTKARCAVVNYSDPFQFNGLEIAYYSNVVNPAPTSVADVVKRGLTVGFNSGSAYIAYAESKGLSADKVSQFPDTPSLLDALQTHRVQVVISDTGSLLLTPAQMQKYNFQHLDYPPDGPFLAGAVAFRKSDTTLYNAFQQKFRALKASGEFQKIADQFGFPPFPASLQNVTAAEACQRVS
jgi:polar amino acid transport system substrate-binding protein